ncbi:lipopolysaccharide biosynthesis protein [Microbacterium sp. NPDC089321]|uniref:lipopolysaccharide biosynthesis protein n=1 Tax=Microbacterium sp. NPDC089321 TaxID=3155183 RepID=UPI003416A065
MTSEQQPPQQAADLGVRATRGAIRAVAAQGALALLQICSVVVLARLLQPADFGLYAMVFSVVGVAYLFRDLGLSAAAIQAEHLTRQQQSNLFWANTGLGAAGAALCLASAPLLGFFYGNAAVVPIAAALACTFVMAGIATQWRAGLVRNMQFGRIAVGEVAAAVAGFGSGIAGAVMGWGPWALVAQQVVGGFFGMVIMGVAAAWLPMRYRRSEPMRDLYRFGGTMFASQVLTYVAAESGAVILGRLFGPYSVGLFNRATQTVRTAINQIRTPLWQVAFTTLARIQNDDARFMRYMLRGQTIVCIPILAVTGGVAAAAGPLTEVVLGAQWRAAAPFIAMIAVGEGINSLASIAGWIFTARGLGRQLLVLTVVTTIVRVSAMLVASSCGALGVVAAFAAAPILLFPVSLWWAGRVSRLATGGLIVKALWILLIAAVPAAVTTVVVAVIGPHANAYLVLAAAIVTHLAGFGLLMVFGRVRREYGEIWFTLRRAMRRKEAHGAQ